MQTLRELHQRRTYFRPVGRWFEIAVGVVCALCGSGLAALGTLGLWAGLVRNGGRVPASQGVF